MFKEKSNVLVIFFVIIFLVFLFYPAGNKSPKVNPEKVGKTLKKLDFGNGTEDFVLNSNRVLSSGEHNYKSVTLKEGTLTVDEAGYETVLVIRANEKIVIEKNASIDLEGRGFSGAGKNSASGTAPGFSFEFAGGGGYHGGAGGSGSCLEERTELTTYGAPNEDKSFGSGGGNGSKEHRGIGGSGGGFVELVAPEVIIEGEISVDGKSGQEQGGGGAGGKIVVLGNKVVLTGKISARGGAGGTSAIQGAGGGGGGIIFVGGDFENKGKLEVNGGKGGSSLDIYTGCNGENGSDGKIFLE